MIAPVAASGSCLAPEFATEGLRSVTLIPDQDDDGKMHLDELVQILETDGIGCVFDLRGELRALVSIVWEVFGADGSYEEGIAYWGYTAQHLTICIEALRRTVGTDERNLINFSGTSRFALNMSMPAIGHPSDCVNFGDAWSMGDVNR